MLSGMVLLLSAVCARRFGCCALALLLDGNLEDRAVGGTDYKAFVVGQVTAVAVGFCAAAVQQGVFEGLAVEQRPQAIDDLDFGDAFFVFLHGVSPSGLCALLI